MAEPLELMTQDYQSLTYDLDAAIAAYIEELAAFSVTTGKPAPSATTLVEGIVRYHDGKYVIVAPPKSAELRDLPTDPALYKDGVVIVPPEPKTPDAA